MHARQKPCGEEWKFQPHESRRGRWEMEGEAPKLWKAKREHRVIPESSTPHCTPRQVRRDRRQQVGFSAPQNAPRCELLGTSPGCPSALSTNHFLLPSTSSLDNPCSQTHRILLKFPKCNINNIMNSYFALRYQIFKSGSHQR